MNSMKKNLEYLKYDWRVNRNFNSRLILLLIRLERVKILGWFILPFRILIVNFLFNTEIPKSVEIGKGLRLPHPYGIIIHGDAKIGDFVTIYQSVTVGSNEFDEIEGRKGADIGNYALLGANSVVIGAINIGDNSIVSACSLLSSSLDIDSYYRDGNTVKNKICLKSYHSKRLES